MSAAVKVTVYSEIAVNFEQYAGNFQRALTAYVFAPHEEYNNEQEDQLQALALAENNGEHPLYWAYNETGPEGLLMLQMEQMHGWQSYERFDDDGTLVFRFEEELNEEQIQQVVERVGLFPETFRSTLPEYRRTKPDSNGDMPDILDISYKVLTNTLKTVTTRSL